MVIWRLKGLLLSGRLSLPEMMVHTGPARVFDSEEEATKAIMANAIKPGDVVVIRYEGPKGGPGMREMLTPTSIIAGMGLDKQVALITDGRFLRRYSGFFYRACFSGSRQPGTYRGRERRRYY